MREGFSERKEMVVEQAPDFKQAWSDLEGKLRAIQEEHDTAMHEIEGGSMNRQKAEAVMNPDEEADRERREKRQALQEEIRGMISDHLEGHESDDLGASIAHLGPEKGLELLQNLAPKLIEYKNADLEERRAHFRYNEARKVLKEQSLENPYFAGRNSLESDMRLPLHVKRAVESGFDAQTLLEQEYAIANGPFETAHEGLYGGDPLKVLEVAKQLDLNDFVQEKLQDYIEEEIAWQKENAEMDVKFREGKGLEGGIHSLEDVEEQAKRNLKNGRLKATAELTLDKIARIRSLRE